MKKYAMTFVWLLACTLVFAQHGGDRKDKGQKGPRDPKAAAAKHADKLKADLTLNDTQYTKVKAIYEQYEQDQATLRRDTSLTKGQEHTKMKKLRDDRDANLKGALTAEQWTKWEALKQEKKDAKEARKDGKKGKDGKEGKGGKDGAAKDKKE
ncbi:hypothetical protein [Dawidia soli]|uniref:Uncharacterized protein n=1 Tax=Dawidia soli TaxID=2782352 RepID=A0AAP2D9S7_9BACT|nr:hypothetical protein [Dawidia soli]MBT1687884.1 hypothetical protein [Dawidia soli]